jgi:F-type H+-transporting ATPase subunit delta
MAENLTLARPYADAAFSLAKAGNALGPWSVALDRMAAVVIDPQMQSCIGNPRLTASQIFGFFTDVVGKLTTEQKNFVQVLIDNDRLGVLPEIRELFVELKNGFEGVKDAEIESAFPIDNATLAQLTADLETRYRCKIKSTITINPDLIGGVRIAIGDQVIDASVRGKLAVMATALKN